MSTANLIDSYADLDLTAPSRAPKANFVDLKDLERITMDLGVAYPASVASAKVVRSNRGDVQLQVTFALHSDSHEQPATGKDTEWLTLPYQESDSQLASRETVRKVTLRRRDDLVRVLAAAVPEQYQLYARRDGTGRTATYYGHEGQVLSRADLNERERSINGAAIQWAKDLHEQEGAYVDSIKGAQLYLVKVENPKNAKYPYLNIFPVRPDSLPVHGTPF